MAAVEGLLAGAVVGMVVLAARAELDQRRAVRLGKLVDEAAGAGDELRDARGRAGQDEGGDAGGAAGHVVDREPSAPRLAEQVAAIEAERGPHLVDLGHEPVDRPERRVVGRVRAAAPELVIDDRRPVLGEALGQREHVVVGGAGAAVQEQNRGGATATQAPVPHAAALDLDISLVCHRFPSLRIPAGIMTGIPRPREGEIHDSEGWSAFGLKLPIFKRAGFFCVVFNLRCQ